MEGLSRIIGLFVVLGVLYWGVSTGGDPMYYMDLPSMIWVIGFTLGGLLMSGRPSAIVFAFYAGVTGCQSDRRAEYSSIMQRGYQVAWGAGILGIFIGLIIMLHNMDDPSAIGPGLAVGLLPLIYGAVLAEVVFAPLVHTLNKPAGSPPSGANQQMHPLAPKLALGAVILLVVMVHFLVMMLAMSEFKPDDRFDAGVERIKEEYGIKRGVKVPDVTAELHATLIDKLEVENAHGR